MAPQTYRKAARLARQTSDLALAAPQVVAHRVARMAAAGAQPSERDQREFSRMVLEKQSAFGEAWTAMALQSVTASQGLALAWMRACTQPWSAGSSTALATQWQSAALGVMGKGLAPVRRTAMANARRLRKG